MTFIISYLTLQSQMLIHVIDYLNYLVLRPFFWTVSNLHLNF